MIGNKYATYNIIQDNQTKMRHNKHEVLRPESVGLDILYCSQNFKWLGFPIFRFERTWWRLLQKRVVPTIKFDIFVFIIQTYKWIRHNELLQKFPPVGWTLRNLNQLLDCVEYGTNFCVLEFERKKNLNFQNEREFGHLLIVRKS